jgi:predicted nuclease of predicted toxin-antitoxin system
MFRLLLDEMTEGRLAEYLAKMGHDVERVVDCPALGPGTDDGDIVAYAEREERLLVTADDDFSRTTGCRRSTQQTRSTRSRRRSTRRLSWHTTNPTT